MIQDTKNSIVKRISGGGRGRVYTSKDFFDLGNRAAVDQSLSRLARKGVIRRLKAGVYDFPKVNPKLGGNLSPNIDEVVHAIARKNNIRIMPSGALAANKLGLSTQVPAQKIFLTDGQSQKVRINNFDVIFRHVSPKRISSCGKRSELVLQALYHLGRNNVDDTIIDKISHMLSKKDKQYLAKDVRDSSEWLIPVVNRIAEVK